MTNLQNLIGDRPTESQRRALMQEIGYVPSPEQEAFHFATLPDGTEVLTKLGAGGERAGKSFSAAVELFTRVFWGKLFWIVGPDYEQTRQEFLYLESFLEKIDNLAESHKPQDGSWSLRTKTGAEVITKSAQEPRTLASKAPDGILLVEAGQVGYDVFLKCRGRVAEKRATNPGGGWLAINGTFEGSVGWYPEMWEAWQTGDNPAKARSFSLPSWSNRVLYPGGFDDPEITAMRAIFPPDYFWERLGGRPTKPSGLVYRELSFEHHVRTMYYDPYAWEADGKVGILVPAKAPVHLWIDPGYDGYWVGFGLVDGPDDYVLDEIFAHNSITEEIVDRAFAHPLWSRVDGVVMDIAGSQHHGVRSPADVWTDLTGIRPRMQKFSPPDEVLRVKSKLRIDPDTGRPHLFVSPSARRLLKEMTQLYKYPTDGAGNVVSNTPIPKDNHGCTGLAYGLLHEHGLTAKPRFRGALPRHKSSWERR